MIVKSVMLLLTASSVFAAGDLETGFRNPPASARPGVYWYFMDGNQDRDQMVADLEGMSAVGIGSVLFLEVDLGLPAGPVPFMSEKWQDNVVNAIKTTDRLGMEFILGTGPGWAGSGGSWVPPQDSMQDLVGSEVQVSGPGVVETKLPVPAPLPPNTFAGMTPALSNIRDQWYQDVAVLAFPTPPEGFARFSDTNLKTLKNVSPYSVRFGDAMPLVRPQADYSEPSAATLIDISKVIDLTSQMKPDGSIRWDAPAGKWTLMRFVSRSTGQTTRPAPRAGHGFECDKFNFEAYRRHWDNFQAPLIKKLGPLTKGKGLTTIHLDSWEMSSQNWTAAFHDEFKKRRGYDPQPFYPAYMGMVVGSLERTERFLWDMRRTSQELVLEKHAGAIKQIAHDNGLLYSNEPYDMNPAGDLDLGSVADIPACEFWNARGGPDTQYSCIEAVSIAHTMGKPRVNAEAFTSDAAFGYLDFPGSLKNQTDWAFAMGINGLIFHTFQHQPLDKGEKPGMNMGPYGVQWHRNQTWWNLSSGYHQYIARCQAVLRQGQAVADILYLTPEGAPNIFVAPQSALGGSARLQDKKGYNFDAVSPRILMRAQVQDGKILFPGGSRYSVLVLPDVATMTPETLAAITALVKSGATVIGNPPRKSPSLVGFPACDEQVRQAAFELWGATPQPERKFGKGRILLNPEANSGTATSETLPLPQVGNWIWFDQGNPAASAAVETCHFRTTFEVADPKTLKSAVIQATADNSFTLEVNGHQVLQGDNFNNIASASVLPLLRTGKNTLTVTAINVGEAPNPAGFIAALQLGLSDGTHRVIESNQSWEASLDGTSWTAARNLGVGTMAPWSLKQPAASQELYPSYSLTAAVLGAMGIDEDFQSNGPIRYGHRRSDSKEIYFLSNTSDKQVSAACRFRVQEGSPELWDPVTAQTRPLPGHSRQGNITSIPMRFEANQSFFVIFPRAKGAGTQPTTMAENFSELQTVAALDGPWQVAFDPKWGGPEHIQFDQLQDWTQHSERGVRYYSGSAIYRKKFDLPAGLKAGTKLALDLGVVHDLCHVRLNGQDLGILWTAPWRVDVSAQLKAQANELEIEVVNRWCNRLIGDQQPEDKDIRTLAWESGLLGGQSFKTGRYTFSTATFFNANSPMQPSGLLGPVRLQK